MSNDRDELANIIKGQCEHLMELKNCSLVDKILAWHESKREKWHKAGWDDCKHTLAEKMPGKKAIPIDHNNHNISYSTDGYFCLSCNVPFGIQRAINDTTDACRLASIISEEEIADIVEKYCCNTVTQYTITSTHGKPEERTFDSGCHIKTGKLANAITEYVKGKLPEGNKTKGEENV